MGPQAVQARRFSPTVMNRTRPNGASNHTSNHADGGSTIRWTPLWAVLVLGCSAKQVDGKDTGEPDTGSAASVSTPTADTDPGGTSPTDTTPPLADPGLSDAWG
ncbi:MAG: hypothetical protein ACI8PZ_002648 [Myxococcota bacterium]|jgi:hypothetical protein